MKMKGYLCSHDGSIALSRNSMTIGRQDCDINIDDPRVESCHAVVEYNQDKQCYVIRDLNTPSGTYVNDCKVQNNAVYVTNGDTIRFGQGGKPYELKFAGFNSTQSSEMATIGGLKRPMSAHTLLENTTFTGSLPEIHSKRQNIKSFAFPRPPMRPRSACEMDRLQTIPAEYKTTGKIPSRQAWGENQHFDALLKPKLQNLLHMVNEMNSLEKIDDQYNRKDSILSGLREQITEICQQMDENKIAANQNLAHELYHIERELEDKRLEISLLRQQLDSVMQSSPTMTTQLAEKDKLIHELRHDLDKAKKEYSMSHGLVQSLQRELSVKEAEIKRKTSEMSLLQKNLRDKDIQFQSLSAKFVRVHDCRTKDEAINTVNEDMKTLRQKIRRLESRSGDHTSLIQRYKNEITQLNEMIKKQENEKETSIKNMEQQKGKFLELQRAERLLRVDVEQAKSRLKRFRGKITKILYSASGVRAPDHPDDAEDSRLIVDLETIIDQREKDMEDIRGLNSELNSIRKQGEEKEASLQVLTETMEDILSTLTENGHHTDILRTKREELSGLELDKSLLQMRRTLIGYIKSEEQWVSEIYSSLQKAGYNVEVTDKTPGYFVSQLHQNLVDKQNQIKDMENALQETEDKHNKEIEDKVHEIQANISNEIDKVREQEKEEREAIISELTNQLESDHGVKLQEAFDKCTEANQTIESLKAELATGQAEIEELNAQLQNTKDELERSKQNENAVNEELKTVLLQQKENKQALNEEASSTKKEFENEIQQYKEEIKQHSITIVKMEERIQGIMKQLEHAKKETERLRAELRESDQAKHRLAPSPPLVVPPLVFDINGYEQTMAALRSELVGAQTQLHVQQTEILALRRDLASSQARISDMKGELSEPLKEQLESGNRIIREKELENAKLRESVNKLSKVVDKQKAEIHASKRELKELRQAVVPREDEQERQRRSPSPPITIPKIATVETGTQDSRIGKINAELTSLGAECKGDRHTEVINRQREALAELRARVKALNSVQPISPGNEELVQQVMLLKKELAEIRARQVMENDSAFRDQLSFSHSGDASARDMAPTHLKPIDAEIERTARMQLEDTLNMSEQSYMDMCNVVGGLLNISNMSGMRSANHLPVDERQKLLDERRQDLESISQHIKSISNRLERKDNLLQNYDKDLAKLREAEEKATQKTAKVSVLLDEITGKNEENAHLREALRRTEERLNQEKRLNTAIKQKKTYHLENLDQRYPPMKHKDKECITSEFEDEALRVRRKKDKSNMMKKEYEIQTLKQKLRSQEQELCQTSAQAANLMQQQHRTHRTSRKGTSSETSSVSSKSSRSSRSRELA
ncbi:forkhead-associated domain-containing protein 1-like [Styela clava]